MAQLAGVTQPTVSRAMRGDRIAETTRQRVLAAAALLGYVPNSLGSSLATSRTNRVALVIEDVTNPSNLWLLHHFERSLARSGMSVVLVRPTGDDQSLFEVLTAGGVDGVALTSLRVHSPIVKTLRERGVPAVLLSRETDEMWLDTCVSNNAAGARLVAERFVQLGHRRFGMIVGRSDTSTGRDRAKGFRDALAEAGVAMHPAAIKEVEHSQPAGREAMLELLDSGQAPTAVFCANDMVAFGALNAATFRGIAVPEELSVIGYDDIAMSAWERLSLTTVHADIEAMASTAARLLLERIGGLLGEPRRVLIEPRLILRSTDGPPPKV